MQCSIGRTQNAAVIPDRNIEALKQMARWVQAPGAVKYALIEQYLAAGRDKEAADYFRDRALAHPDDPLMLSGEALFQARVAATIDLPMERLPAIDEAFEKLDRAVTLAENSPVVRRTDEKVAAAITGHPIGGRTTEGMPTFASAVPRCFRGIVAAQLPRFLNRTEGAVADLNSAIEAWKQNPDALPHGLRRSAYRALAKAYTTLGKADKAKAAIVRAGSTAIDPAQPLFTTEASFSKTTGFRFTPTRILQPASGVFLAQGYDLTDIVFVRTAAGIVAIDNDVPSAHFDVAAADFQKTYAGAIVTHLLTRNSVDSTGTTTSSARVAMPEQRKIGGVVFGIYPLPADTTSSSGKSVIALPASGIVFAGDAFRQYCEGGESWSGKQERDSEGLPKSLFALLKLLRSLQPKLLLHAYAPLTEYVTANSLPGLEAALHEITTNTETQLAAQKPLWETLANNTLPERLQAFPSSALPFLLIRDTLISRLYQQNGSTDSSVARARSMYDDVPPQRMADALRQTAGGKEAAFVRALQSLQKQDDIPTALRVADLGLKTYPASKSLAALHRQALNRLLVKTQHLGPFAFLYYSGLADFEMLPVP